MREEAKQLGVGERHRQERGGEGEREEAQQHVARAAAQGEGPPGGDSPQGVGALRSLRLLDSLLGDGRRLLPRKPRRRLPLLLFKVGAPRRAAGRPLGWAPGAPRRAAAAAAGVAAAVAVRATAAEPVLETVPQAWCPVGDERAAAVGVFAVREVVAAATVAVRVVVAAVQVLVVLVDVQEGVELVVQGRRVRGGDPTRTDASVASVASVTSAAPEARAGAAGARVGRRTRHKVSHRSLRGGREGWRLDAGPLVDAALAAVQNEEEAAQARRAADAGREEEEEEGGGAEESR
jgi:hypothetical protein